MFEVNELNAGTDLNNLTYYYTGESALKYFVHFKGRLITCNDIKNGRISLQKQEKF